MSYYFGIYGFEITRPILTEHFSLLPRFTAFAEAQGMAADGTKFHLTAVGMVNDQPDDEALFNLTAALTFCQQRWVAASQVVSLPDAVEASEVIHSTQRRAVSFSIFAWGSSQTKHSTMPPASAQLSSDMLNPGGCITHLLI